LIYLALEIGVYTLYVLVSGQDFKLLDIASDIDVRWILLALLTSILGVITFHLGYFAAGTKRNGAAQPPRSFVVQRVSLLAWISAPIVAYSIYSVFFSRGGFAGYQETFVEMRYSGTTTGYFSYLASGFVSILALLLFVTSLKEKPLCSVLIASIVLFAIAVITAGLTGFRIMLAPVLLSTAACYHYKKRWLTKTKTLAFFIVLYLLFAVYGVIRERVETGGAQRQASTQQFAESVLLRVPGVEMVGITIGKILDGEPYQKAWPAFWESMTILIPRSIWYSKPIPQSMVYGERIMGYYAFLRDGRESANTGGYSMTVIGYLYWQFGIVAVAIGMFGLGYLFRLTYQIFMSRPLDHSVSFIYLSIYGNMPKFAEAPQDCFNGILIILFFAIPIAIFCRERSCAPGDPHLSRAPSRGLPVASRAREA
jgi:hypothetical protein